MLSGQKAPFQISLFLNTVLHRWQVRILLSKQDDCSSGPIASNRLMKCASYQGVAAVARQNNHVNRSCVVGDADTVRFRSQRLIVKLDNTGEASTQNSETGQGCPSVNHVLQLARRHNRQQRRHCHQERKLHVQVVVDQTA